MKFVLDLNKKEFADLTWALAVAMATLRNSDHDNTDIVNRLHDLHDELWRQSE